MNAQGEREVREGPSVAVSREIAAEAAVWIARLHGPDRSPGMVQECLAWQARSAAHRLAFERCTEVWEAVPGVRLADAYASAGAHESASGLGGIFDGSKRSRLLLASLLAVLLTASGVAVHLWRGTEVHETRVGEQQVVMLDDGTRMYLNTATRVRVKMDSDQRSLNVEGGEALFEVAKDAHRPFVVQVAGSEVVAVGTAFSVRHGAGGLARDDGLTVTLIEGEVTVRPATTLWADGVAPDKQVSMHAGERMRLLKAPGPSSGATILNVDMPRIDQLVAWRRNEVVFDDVSLPDAVADMNRYSKTHIALVGAPLMTLRVSGQYRAGDSAGFARAVASLHGLAVREHEGRLELAIPQ